MSALSAMANAHNLQQLLDDAIVTSGVPGASLAILENDEILTCASGVLNIDTGVEATPDSLFQIGSITKAYTAALVMQLVDCGLVELDAPVSSYLSDFTLADRSAAKSVTVRQLLDHSAGFDGDYFVDAGYGEDRIENYAQQCYKEKLPQLYEPGQFFSYNNAAYVLLGRLIEKIGARTWDETLAEDLLSPLGLDETTSRPEEALRRRAAVGHMPNPATGELALTKHTFMPPSAAPAGTTIMASAADVVRFARAFFNNSVGAPGSLLSCRSTRAMLSASCDCSFLGNMHSWGIGWMLTDWSGAIIHGHDGGAVGHSAFLRFIPEKNFAIALLTNGVTGFGVFTSVVAPILERVSGGKMQLPPPPLASADMDFRRFEGRYERINAEISVSDKGDRLSVHFTPKLDPFGIFQSRGFDLLPISQTSFVTDSSGGAAPVSVHFLDPDKKGRPQLLHMGMRAFKRTSSRPA